jgi:hypothetical protein
VSVFLTDVDFFLTIRSFLDEISRITALRYFPSDRRLIAVQHAPFLTMFRGCFESPAQDHGRC